MQATVVAVRGSRALVAAAVTTLLVFGLVLAGAAITRAPSIETASISVADIPQGATLQHLDGRGVILVRAGDDIRAFSAWDGRGDPLVLCKAAGIFTTSVYASRYRFDGSKLGGPGPGPLDQYATHIEGDDLVVTLSHRFDHPVPRWSDGMPSVFTNVGGYCPPGG